jgi:DNA primase catalytic core
VTGRATFKAFVEEVRDRSDLVEVIGRDVELRRAGSTLKGLSPFHTEKHASFVVWPATQTWHDYSNGGGKGGDVFTYVQEREKVGFKEAVLLLAERAGVRRPNQGGVLWKRELAAATERREVERLLGIAARYYHRRLPDKIRDRLWKQRYGFTDETIDRLQLGWADGHLFDHLIAEAGGDHSRALKTGLFVVLAGGRVVDLFRNRLVFPYWRGGRVVYFTARRTEYTSDEAWEEPKYKKLLTHSDEHSYVSPTVRNDFFYNEDAARGADELVITEGTPDCISAMQSGVACISTSTTSFRGQDLPRLLELSRHAKRLIICNDAEKSAAGEVAAAALAAALWNQSREVCIATIPRPDGIEKIDINELVIAHGPDALRAVLSEAKSYPDYLLERIPAESPKPDLDRLLEPVLTSLVACSPIRADVVLDAITAKLGVRRKALMSRMKALAAEAKTALDAKAAQADAAVGVQAERGRQDALRAHPSSAAAPSDADPQESRSKIRVNNRQLRDLITDTWSAIRTANDPPQLFVRSGALVRLAHGDDGPFIDLMNESGTYGYLARIADWVKVTQEAVLDVSPARDVARDMLVNPHTELPQLEAVVSAPVFDANGAIVATPGYHPHARLWYWHDGLQIPAIPERPTADQVAAARALLLDDLLFDFPFTADSDRAHALGALLLPFVRRMVAGCTPIHLIEAPTPGSGKGLLADIVSILIVGRPCDPTTLTRDEDETRKKITSILLKAQPVILLDNIKDGIDSAQLAAAITAERWSDRILGQSRMLDLPNRATWLTTINNAQLTLEIARRSVRVRIDAKVDQPWKRTGFRHDPIRDWVRANRAELVHAVVVLVRGWIAVGSPPSKRVLGSFESWARVVGGILEHAGVPGFLQDADQLYEAADADGQEWRELVAAWWDKLGPRWVAAGEILTLALEKELLGSIIRDKAAAAQRIRLGKALSARRDRQFGACRLIVGRNSNTKASQYRLVDASGGTDRAAPGEQLELQSADLAESH